MPDCRNCGRRRGHLPGCAQAPRPIDPDVRRQCMACRGPVYVDEPDGQTCPDCTALLARAREARRERDEPEPHAVRRGRGLSFDVG